MTLKALYLHKWENLPHEKPRWSTKRCTKCGYTEAVHRTVVANFQPRKGCVMKDLEAVMKNAND